MSEGINMFQNFNPPLNVETSIQMLNDLAFSSLDGGSRRD